MEQLQQLDGYYVAAAIVGIAIVLMVLPRLIVRLGATETDRDRAESHSETAHRIDAEATAATRPVHAGRKAGRTAVTQ